MLALDPDAISDEEQPQPRIRRKTVEERNNYISLHHKPGLSRRLLVASVALNAVLLMAGAWIVLRLWRIEQVCDVAKLTGKGKGKGG